MSIQSVDQRLDGRLVEVTHIGGRLPWLLPQHHGLWIDQPANLPTSNFTILGWCHILAVIDTYVVVFWSCQITIAIRHDTSGPALYMSLRRLGSKEGMHRGGGGGGV